MIGFYNYTVILTYLSLISSMIGCFMSIKGNLSAALILLLLSGFFDLFDGKVARTMKRTRMQMNFGIQIDSLADVIAFGVLPSLIVYNSGVNSVIGIIILSLFTLCGLIRLAYYNVCEQERQLSEETVRKEYLGLPITSSAIIVPLTFIFKYFTGDFFIYILEFVMLVTAILFITPVKVKKPGKRGMIAVLIIGIIIGAACLLPVIFENIF